MIKQIWKYEFNKDIELPIDSKILSVQIQNETPHMWIMVNPENDFETRHFTIIGTGHSFEDKNHKYIGTFQDNPFVWHLFEIV